MSEGVPVLDPEASKPDTDPTDDNEYHAINPPTNRDLKKDLKTRRKAREERAKQAERHLSKMEQKKISDIYRYGNFGTNPYSVHLAIFRLKFHKILRYLLRYLILHTFSFAALKN